MNTSIKINYLGHSCFLIETLTGKRLLVDPWLRENPYAVVQPENLKNIDMIAVTHGAFDHLGNAVEICKSNDCKLFCGSEVALYAMDNGVTKDKIKILIYGTTWNYEGIEIRAVEAKHISIVPYQNQKLSGSALSYIFRMEDGTGIYFSGDTSIFSDLKLFGQLYPVDIALIGMDNLPGCPREMSGWEAALAVQWLGVKYAIPMHYPHDSKDPEEFQNALEKTSITPILLKPGQNFMYSKKITTNY